MKSFRFILCALTLSAMVSCASVRDTPPTVPAGTPDGCYISVNRHGAFYMVDVYKGRVTYFRF